MDDNFVVLHNGSDVSGSVINVNDTYSVTDVLLTRVAADSIESVFSFDISVTVNIAAGIINFVLPLPVSAQGTTTGLLGNFNGDETDEFVYPDGVTTLPNNATDRMIHAFGQQCKYSTPNKVNLHVIQCCTYSLPNIKRCIGIGPHTM